MAGQMTIQDFYAQRCNTPSDISQLLPILKDFADKCEVVVEFGVRHGFSTSAFLASKAKRIFSYDISIPTVVLPPEEAERWAFIHADTSRLETADIPVCDMLFIDTLHTEQQVREELRQCVCVHKFIAFHDVFLFGLCDEGYGNRDGMSSHPGQGILPAIMEFLVDHPEWRPVVWTTKNNGLLILEKSTLLQD